MRPTKVPSPPICWLPTWKKVSPRIEKVVRIDNNSGAFITYEDRQYTEEAVYYVDSTFLAIFSFPLLEGDAQTALDAPNAVVISQSDGQ